jgi:hypothetical protein
MKNIKKILQFIVRNPIECKRFYLGLFLNVFFYISFVYNFAVLYYSAPSPYIGWSLILGGFSSISAYLSVYGLPFAFKFDVSHILGQIYIYVLSLLTCVSTVYFLGAPSWVYLGVLLVGCAVFNITYASSTYFQSLSKLKSLPIWVQYKKLFFDVIPIVSMGTVVGLCWITFDIFPLVLKGVCVYTYLLGFLLVIFNYVMSFFKTDVNVDINKKQSRKLPTAILKLLIMQRKNPGVFYDLRISYLAFFTILRAYFLFLYAFLGASIILEFIHVFSHYVISVFIVTLVVGFQKSQKWILTTYGPKSLRLLGWNTGATTAANAQKAIFWGSAVLIGKTGFETQASETNYSRKCASHDLAYKQINTLHDSNTREYGHDSYKREIIDAKYKRDVEGLVRPTRENTRVTLLDPQIIELTKKTIYAGGKSIGQIVYDTTGLGKGPKGPK